MKMLVGKEEARELAAEFTKNWRIPIGIFADVEALDKYGGVKLPHLIWEVTSESVESWYDGSMHSTTVFVDSETDKVFSWGGFLSYVVVLKEGEERKKTEKKAAEQWAKMATTWEFETLDRRP